MYVMYGQPRFSHFLREPTPAERFNGDQALDSRALLSVTRRLARCCARSRDINELDPNPGIPAGYTYLAQLIGHDLVHSSLSSMDLQDPPMPFPLNNLRGAALCLDTLYGQQPPGQGAGYFHPTESRNRHEPEQQRLRGHLRLGQMRNPDGTTVPRDLPRGASDIASDSSQDSHRRYPEVFIGDSRNDGNWLLAQLTAQFHRLHNRLLAKLEADPALRPSAPLSMELDDELCFQLARHTVVSTLHWIVQEDFLPRLLDPGVRAQYQERDWQPLLGTSLDAGMPLEFSHAAFRFGHAMVQPSYRLAPGRPRRRLEALLNTRSARRPGYFPLWQANWLVDWSLFFDKPGQATPGINPSRRIRPGITGPLARFASLQGPPPRDLAERDLLRSLSPDRGLWSVPALQAEIARRSPLLEPLIGGDYHHRVLDWLEKFPEPGDDPDLDQRLASDPPLNLFVLLEADYSHAGLRLGVLGSIIVAEVLCAAMTAYRQRLPGSATGMLAGYPDKLFREGFGAAMPTHMNALMDFIDT